MYLCGVALTKMFKIVVPLNLDAGIKTLMFHRMNYINASAAIN